MQWQLARPLVALRDRLRRYGYTVYDIGDARHLDHVPPEDHTPYSETGWPGTTPYGWVTAIDIMPPPTSKALPSLQALGRRMHDDRNAGYDGASWLKYMNWGPADDRHAVHCKWQPSHQQLSSGDVGHLHLSSRSDVTQSMVGDNYDPVARLRGQSEGDGDMAEKDVIDIVNLLINGTSTAGYADKDTNPLNDAAATMNLTILGGKLDQIITALGKLGGAVQPPTDSGTPVDIATVVAALKSSEGQEAIRAAAFQAAQDAERQ
jgi:hypothetical protein